MAHPHDHWEVLPHGPLTCVADNLYTVTGPLKMPLGETVRRMTVVPLADGRLVIYSAIALNEPELAKLLALGRPSYLVVPNGIHRMDVKGWKQRFPSMTVIAPRGAQKRVNELVQVDANEYVFDDPRVHLSVVPGTAEQEFAMLVDTETGKTLVVNDLIFNLPAIPGVGGWMMRLLGFGPGRAFMPKLVRMKLVKDKAAVRGQLEAWAKLGRLERILVSHGNPIDDPQRTLRSLARGLT